MAGGKLTELPRKNGEPEAAIGRDGLHIRGSVGGKPVLGTERYSPVPWEQIEEFEVDEGKYHIYFLWTPEELAEGYKRKVTILTNKGDDMSIMAFATVVARKFDLWLGQASFFKIDDKTVKLSDGRPVYNLNVPKIKFLCDLPAQDDEFANSSNFKSINSDFKEYKGPYATPREFYTETQKLAVLAG